MAVRRKHIKLCREKVLPMAKQMTAASRALSENPANVPSLGRSPRPAMGAPPSNERARMALVTGKRWAPGRKLTVSFKGGSSTVRKKIEKYARKWMEFANVDLVFKQSSNAEIRIAFDRDDGSWSYLGTDALSINKNKATMNYGWLYDNTSAAEYSRVVLHEFGHALGCIHEHSHPEHGIPWDKPKVYAYYKEKDGWTKDEVDDQVFFRYSKSHTSFSKFDKKSIMLYAVPQALTVGNYAVGWNRVLSANDKSFIKTMYPGRAERPVDLVVGAPRIEARIGKRGEEDLFKFEIEEAGRYRISTSGVTDVVMILLGPDSQTRRIAEDDDSGYGYNPKIEELLMPGTYYARVRHYYKSKTGNYKIGLTKRPF